MKFGRKTKRKYFLKSRLIRVSFFAKNIIFYQNIEPGQDGLYDVAKEALLMLTSVSCALRHSGGQPRGRGSED